MATSKVVFGGQTLVDLTSDTVTEETLAYGVTAHMANGRSITGTMVSDVTSVNGMTGDVELTAADVGATSVTRFTVTLSHDGWSASAPYTQTVAVNGLKTTNRGIVDVNLAEATTADGLDILDEWRCVSRVYPNAENYLTAVCYEERPEVNIPLQIEVI